MRKMSASFSRDQHVGRNLSKETRNKTNKTTIPVNKRKTFNFKCLTKSGPAKWRANNVQLARENAKLKKDVQTLTQLYNDLSVSYNHVELAWIQRGEALSKVDIISRMALNQIKKLVDTVAEICSACQGALARPVGGGLTENLDRITRLRHSMPSVKMGRLNKSYKVSQLPSKGQLVNHVNPMISGHPIIKPTITLQRINLQNISPPRSPVEEIQTPLTEVEPAPIEVDLTSYAENVSSSAETSDEEEEIVEVPATENEERLVHHPSSRTYNSMRLPVAEVPLERLPLTRISERHSMSPGKSIVSRLITQDNRLVDSPKPNVKRNTVSPQTPASRSSLPSLPEEDRITKQLETFSSRNTTISEEKRPSNATYSFFKDTSEVLLERCNLEVTSVIQNALKSTDHQPSRNSEHEKSPLDSDTPLSSRRSSMNIVKKYPPSSRSRSPMFIEQRKNQKSNDIEKCRLVVALKDVGSYLHNGTVASIEQLEEWKVKTGASAHQECKDRNNENISKAPELSLCDTTIEDQTELNFTAEIGIMDYSMQLNNDDVEGSSLSPREEFLKRIQTEDPLEGPSWRFQAREIPTGRKRARNRSLPPVQSSRKRKSVSHFSEDSMNISSDASKKQSLDISEDLTENKNNSNHLNDVMCGEINCNADMELTSCTISHKIANLPEVIDHVKEETNNNPLPAINSSPISEKSRLSESPSDEKVVQRKKKKIIRLTFSPDESYSNPGSDYEWKPCSRKTHSQKTSRNRESRDVIISSEWKSRSRKTRSQKTSRNRESRDVIIYSESKQSKEKRTVNKPASLSRKSMRIKKKGNESQNRKRKSPSPVVKIEDSEITSVETAVGDKAENFIRGRRNAAPKSLKEPSLNRKLRRVN